jgi:hypothetical protein
MCDEGGRGEKRMHPANINGVNKDLKKITDE